MTFSTQKMQFRAVSIVFVHTMLPPPSYEYQQANAHTTQTNTQTCPFYRVPRRGETWPHGDRQINT